MVPNRLFNLGGLPVADLFIRGVDQVVVDNIKLAAIQRGLSVDRLVADALAELFGGTVQQRYHDLDALAGTWSKKDLQAFEEGTA
jgi:hypothetical protein